MVAREYDGIRDLVAEQIERLEALFPGKQHLWQKEIAQAFGVSTDFVRERYGIRSDGIDIVSFAWLLARMACKIEQRAAM